MKKILYIVLVVGLLLGSYVFLAGQTKSDEEPQVSTSTQNRMMSIENYVKIYISELSPVEEALGGRFYVTKIETGGGKGTVSYEDGHNDYTADFTYETENSGEIQVNSFVVRK